MNNFITGLLASDGTSGAGALGIIFLIIFLYFLFIVGIYLYTSFAFIALAKKTNTEPEWLAWIPIVNLVLLAKIAKKHWWPILLSIPALIFYIIGIILITFELSIAGWIFIILYLLTILAFMIFLTIWYWKTFEAVGKPGWWSLTAIISSVIGMITVFSGPVGMAISVIISISGTIAFLILLGIAAWSKSPSDKVEIKTNRKKIIRNN